MRLKQIAAVCAKLKRVVLCQTFDEGEHCEQWIGDGAALYPAFDIPALDEESVFSVFDIPAETRKKWMVRIDDGAGYPFSMKDSHPSDRPLDGYGVSIGFGGVTFEAFKTEDEKPLFIDARYLKPIAHLLDETTFYERDAGVESEVPSEAPKKISVVVAKTGMMISAIIMPKDPTRDRNFVAQLSELSTLCVRERKG